MNNKQDKNEEQTDKNEVGGVYGEREVAMEIKEVLTQVNLGSILVLLSHCKERERKKVCVPIAMSFKYKSCF